MEHTTRNSRSGNATIGVSISLVHVSRPCVYDLSYVCVGCWTCNKKNWRHRHRADDTTAPRRPIAIDQRLSCALQESVCLRLFDSGKLSLGPISASQLEGDDKETLYSVQRTFEFGRSTKCASLVLLMVYTVPHSSLVISSQTATLIQIFPFPTLCNYSCSTKTRIGIRIED